MSLSLSFISNHSGWCYDFLPSPLQPPAYMYCRFMIGLGNPLVGPSAVDAVVAGCVYINPIYDQPVKDMYWSQHPYLEKEVSLYDPYWYRT